ncbi:hypothetical protein PROFUN_07347 [Planoprotostelium fungivorum]|uniref:Uncharacterized protein n=1 Tax=Planoprotostelium fungivorum TaxID=1890364 RepID=A0A2P6NM20_9EUKA|nr:hypothetical protein PROFUN_07347 [Planoprotostelium fungivorum]
MDQNSFVHSLLHFVDAFRGRNCLQARTDRRKKLPTGFHDRMGDSWRTHKLDLTSNGFQLVRGRRQDRKPSRTRDHLNAYRSLPMSYRETEGQVAFSNVTTLLQPRPICHTANPIQKPRPPLLL